MNIKKTFKRRKYDQIRPYLFISNQYIQYNTIQFLVIHTLGLERK